MLRRQQTDIQAKASITQGRVSCIAAALSHRQQLCSKLPRRWPRSSRLFPSRQPPCVRRHDMLAPSQIPLGAALGLTSSPATPWPYCSEYNTPRAASITRLEFAARPLGLLKGSPPRQRRQRLVEHTQGQQEQKGIKRPFALDVLPPERGREAARERKREREANTHT